MAKNKKKNGAAQDENAVQDQQKEQGTVNAKAKSGKNEEAYEEEQSRPGNRSDDRGPVNQEQESDEQKVGETAVEAGDKPDTRREKQRSGGMQATKGKTSTNGSRTSNKSSSMSAKSRGPAKKTSQKGKTSSAQPKGKSKSKSKSR